MVRQWLHTAEQPSERLLRILQFFHVSTDPAGFHHIEESSRRLGGPRGEGILLWKAIEGLVDLDRIKSVRVVFEHDQLLRFHES